MLIVSLHSIKVHAPHGLYPEENILGNDFEIDVDITLPTSKEHPLPFVDYTLIQSIVESTFNQGWQLLEAFAQHIHTSIKINVPIAEKIRVAIRKMHPPLAGEVKYAQVVFEM
jgi:dihydroneopterin aldolase